MTHLCVADRDSFANDVPRGGGLCTHRNLMFLGLFTLCLYLCVDLFFLCDKIVCVFPSLDGY